MLEDRHGKILELACFKILRKEQMTTWMDSFFKKANVLCLRSHHCFYPVLFYTKFNKSSCLLHHGHGPNLLAEYRIGGQKVRYSLQRALPESYTTSFSSGKTGVREADNEWESEAFIVSERRDNREWETCLWS